MFKVIPISLRWASVFELIHTYEMFMCTVRGGLSLFTGIYLIGWFTWFEFFIRLRVWGALTLCFPTHFPPSSHLYLPAFYPACLTIPLIIPFFDLQLFPRLSTVALKLLLEVALLKFSQNLPHSCSQTLQPCSRPNQIIGYI